MLACGAVANAALGQSTVRDTTAQRADSVHATAHHPAPWLTRDEKIAFAAAAVGTFAIAPLDHPISSELVEPNWQRSRRLHQVAGDVAFLGGDGPFVASTVLLAGTTMTGNGALRRFAIHNIESIALATVITGIGKGISGRALPGVQTKHAFELGRGFHEANGPFVSFPSGHTAAAFAMAATIAGELRAADSTHARLLDWTAFGGAAAVGIARVVQRMHWPSDLPMAAFIGTWSGRVVQRHANDDGVIGTVLRGMTVGMGPNGRTEFGWSSLAAGESAR